MRGECVRRETAGHQCGYTEGSDFENDLSGGRRSESDECAQLLPVRPGPMGEERVTAAALMLPGEEDQNSRHVDAGEAGGDGRSLQPHGGETEMAVDERPVPSPVDEIGGDECEGDGAHAANALQITAEGGVDEQRQRAEIENVQVHGGLAGDCGIDAEAGEEQRHRSDAEHGEWRICDDQVDALREPLMTDLEVAASPGLRDDRVQTEQDADAEERRSIVRGAGDADCADSLWTEPADHDGVDDAHGDPAELRQDDRNGQRKQRAQLMSQRRKIGRSLHRLKGILSELFATRMRRCHRICRSRVTAEATGGLSWRWTESDPVEM